MKINLGCGPDIKSGYVNVDLRKPCDVVCDLSKLPWPFQDSSADEILMLDFLEHFPYRLTESIIQEVWRILKPGAFVDIQVPDLEHCARAAQFDPPFLCNRCGWEYHKDDLRANFFVCGKCKQDWIDCALAATHRLYGGQDYEGNWHYNAFSRLLLKNLMYRNGFGNEEELEYEHQKANWNFKFRFFKVQDVWGK